MMMTSMTMMTMTVMRMIIIMRNFTNIVLTCFGRTQNKTEQET